MTTTTPCLHSIRWILDDEGGGVVVVFIDHGAGHTAEHRYEFRSFDGLPDDVTNSIRKDGRTEGEITTTPS